MKRVCLASMAAVVCAAACPQRACFVDGFHGGCDISAAYPSEEGIVLRLFNAAGDGSVQKIKLGFPAASVPETDLNGKLIAQKKIKKTADGCEIEVSMPRFGLRTLAITK